MSRIRLLEQECLELSSAFVFHQFHRPSLWRSGVSRRPEGSTSTPRPQNFGWPPDWLLYARMQWFYNLIGLSQIIENFCKKLEGAYLLENLQRPLSSQLVHTNLLDLTSKLFSATCTLPVLSPYWRCGSKDPGDAHTGWWIEFDDVCIRSDTIPQRDGRTDGLTDGIGKTISRCACCVCRHTTLLTTRGRRARFHVLRPWKLFSSGQFSLHS